MKFNRVHLVEAQLKRAKLSETEASAACQDQKPLMLKPK